MIIAFKSKLLLLMQLLFVLAISPLALLFFVPTIKAEVTENIPIEAINEIKEKEIGLPIRLHIPRIGVDALFEHVGFTSTGAMDTPEGPVNVAWFEYGPRPGERGSAVVNGHYGWRDEIPAVFDSLNTLVKGDRIYVVDDNQEIISFVVTNVMTYNEQEDAFNVFNSTDDKAHLNIITCEGKWNPATKRYSDRLVVFADKEL